jgi:hypothetical protein
MHLMILACDRRSALYRRRQPIHLTFYDVEPVIHLPLARERLTQLVNLQRVNFEYVTSGEALLAITSAIAVPHLQVVEFRSADTPSDAVGDLLKGAPRLEMLTIGLWKGNHAEAFSFAPASLRCVKISSSFDDEALFTLAKLPHLEELTLPVQSKARRLPPPSVDSFRSLTRLTLEWTAWLIEAGDRPLEQLLTQLVQVTPQVRMLALDWHQNLQQYFEQAMKIITAWPPTVLPQLQHFVCPPYQMTANLPRLYKSLVLHHLQPLLSHRPVHPFCVHILVDEEELSTPESAAYQLPCVRLTVPPQRVIGSSLVNAELLRQMDAAAQTITVSKEELLEMIQAEQLRLQPSEPAAV